MKRFKNLSIQRKLLTGFLSMLAIVLIVGAVGIAGMIKIDQMDTYLYKEQTAPIVHLINATKSLYQIRVDARSAVINAGKAEKIKGYESSYLSEKQTFLTESAAYQKSVTHADTLKIYGEASDIFNHSFDPAIQKTFELAKAGDQAGADAAGAAVTDKVQTLFQDYDKLAAARMSSAKSTSDANDSTAMILTIALSALLLFGAGAAIFLGLRISQMISKPIGRVVSAADRIALGYVDVDLKDVDSEDETGRLAASFIRMLEGIRRQAQVAEIISNGDFTQEVPLRSDGDELGLALQKIKSDLSATLQRISIAADQVGVGASQVSDASQALASGATEQAATVEELSASVAGISKQAGKNAENARRAAEYVEQAGDGISKGNEHMDILGKAMAEIRESSNKISNITKVIEDIAFQTNILALNAAIEAARAGDAGKGFAVVADEVRSLAAKSAEAAKQTADLIQRSADTVANGEKMSAEAASILQNAEENERLVDDAIHQIAAASSEQADAIRQITQGLSQVSDVVQTNAATAEESSASSEELAAQAHAMRMEIGKFKLPAEDTGTDSQVK